MTDARIRQVTKSSGQQIQKIVQQVIERAIKDAYKNPFTLLDKLGKQKFSQLKRKISKMKNY